MSKLSRFIGIFLAALFLLLMSACGKPVHRSETSKSESSSSQGKSNSSSNSESTNSSSSQGNDNSSSNSNSTIRSSPQGNNNPSSNSDLKNSSSSKKMTPTFNQTDLDRLEPGFRIVVSKIIHFPDHDVIVAGIAKPDNYSLTSPKVIVFQFDKVSGSWMTKWSRDINPANFGEYQSILVTQPNKEKMAIALVTADFGMSLNKGEALALMIDDNGTCTLEDILDTIRISSNQQGDVLIVTGGRELGMRKLSLQGKNFVESVTPASQLSPAGSIQVAFKLDNDGNVVAAQQNTLNMKVGQTIAFVPADEKTKEEFDRGAIEIFTDWGDGDLDILANNGIWTGNFFKLVKNGTVQFLLMTDKKWTDTVNSNTTIKPTFTVHVLP